MFDGAPHDIRLAFRQLWKAKGFTLTAVITLALGLGANTAIFTLVHAVMLDTLPVAQPEQLYRLGDSDNCCVIGGYQGRFSIFSYPLYTYLRDHTPEFDKMAAFQAGVHQVGARRVGNGAASEPVVDQFVSGNYFSMFGVNAFAGRLLEPNDDVRGAPPAAVMSYRTWEQRYAKDPTVVGASFVIEGAPFTIVGIAPPRFYGDTLRVNPPDFWMPLAVEPAVHQVNALLDRTTDHWLYIIGRLKPGTPLAPLEAEVNAELSQWLEANNPPASELDKRTLARQHITLAPAAGGVSNLRANYERDLRLLMAMTGLVLLVACANLANLLLARGTARAAQTAIRVALGASRARLVRLTLIESVVLAVLGGGAGLLVAGDMTAFLIRLAFVRVRYVPIETNPSLPVLGFAFLLSLATGIAFGIAPAWSGSSADPAVALRGAGRSTGGRTTLAQKSLVAVQTALSLVLLAGAGLMVQTLRHLTDQQFGYQSEGRMVVNVNAGFGGYAPAKLATIYSEIEQQMERLPGVRRASLSLYSPMEGNNWQSGVHTEERPEQVYSPSWDRVSPSFFETIGSRILRGRMFNEHDTPDSTHVAVVNQTFADKLFPNEDPLGKRFGLGGLEHRSDYQIVGVVENVRFRNPRQPAPPMFFVPLLQMWKSEWEDSGKARSNIIGNIELHVSGMPADLGPKVQRKLSAIDPNLTMLELTTIDAQLGSLVRHELLIARLAQLFGLLALAVASVGLYGITAYSVAQRTGEIGIRCAMGASRTDIVRMILRGALMQAAIGLAIGIPAALAAGRVLADQLFGVKSYDAWNLGGAALLLMVCACAAGAGPALQAASIDPVRMLRVDR